MELLQCLQLFRWLWHLRSTPGLSKFNETLKRSLPQVRGTSLPYRYLKKGSDAQARIYKFSPGIVKVEEDRYLNI